VVQPAAPGLVFQEIVVQVLGAHFPRVAPD